MTALLLTFGVKTADMSPFLREFNSVLELREAYTTFLSDYADDADDEDGDEGGDLEDEQSSSTDDDSVDESEETTISDLCIGARSKSNCLSLQRR